LSKGGRAAAPQHRRKLAFEPLEDRSLLSVCIWTGGGGAAHNNWNNPANWVNDQTPPVNVAPQAGDQLQFVGTPPSGGAVNDFPAGTQFQSIDFADSGFTLSGNSIALTGGTNSEGINVASGVTGSTISLNVVLAQHITIAVSDSAAISISGVLSGTNYLTKTGAGTLSLGGANTYSGGTAIEGGILKVENDAALVQCGNGFLVNGSNAVLDLNGHSITVGQVGLIDGLITSSTPATLTGSEYVVLNGTIDVPLGDNAAPLLKGTTGTVTLSRANAYTGLTTVYAGQLNLVGSDAWNRVLNLGGADVRDGKLVLDYAAGGAATDPVTTVRGDLASGLIGSTTAPSGCTIGYDDNNATGNGVADAVMLQTALAGDANLDGHVNGTDLGKVLANWGLAGRTWNQGDFNYDGLVNGADLGKVLANWGQQPTALPPQVLAIDRLGSTAVTSSTVQFVVVFSGGVTNVDTTNFSDFDLQQPGTTGNITSIVDCSPSHAVYLVTVENVYGNGTLGLDFDDADGSVEDYATNVALPVSNRSFSEPEQVYTVASPFIWVGGADSDWYTAANWAGDTLPIAGSSLLFEGTAPGGGTHDNFPDGTAFNSIELASGGFDFDSLHDLTLTGGITLDAGVADTTISANLILGASVAIDVSNYDANTDATLTISGDISGGNSLTKTGPGELYLTGNNSYAGLTRVCGGTLELGLNAQSPVLPTHYTGAGGADIQQGSVVFDYTSAANDPAADILQILTTSYNNGSSPFASGQIRDTTAAATSTALGWADDTTHSHVTIACTLPGDANLDGAVNGADLGRLLPKYGCTGQTWSNGDFTYDGLVTGADLGRVFGNWGRRLNPDLSLTASSTFPVVLSDDGPDTLVVKGAVRLGNATLNVTSTRTDTDYGILRVLIQNDDGDPVIGTFNNLPEGAEVDVAGVSYYITYHYNAESHEFGTGNDVALVSSPSFSVSSALLSSQTVTLDYASDSHSMDATLVPRYTCSQFQLSTAVWTQRYPAWANATFSFQSEDSTIASVDSTTGLVTFLPQKGAEGEVYCTCPILVTATVAGQSPQTIEIQVTGTSIEDTYYVPDTINGTDTPANNVGDYVLVLYNADSTGGGEDNVISSTALMEYYKATRPGMANANYLGISAAMLKAAYTNGDIATDIGGVTTLPDTAGTSWASHTICEAITEYVAYWLQDHNWLGQDQSKPTTPIRYIVGLCGLPSRDDIPGAFDVGGNSVSSMIYNDALSISHGKGYTAGTDRFSLAEYGAPLIAWLDCGSYEATKAYIAKEKVAAAVGGLQSDGITISGSAAGIDSTTYYFDDTQVPPPNGPINLFGQLPSDLEGRGVGVPASDIVYRPAAQNSPITVLTDPTAYGSWGYHTTDSEQWENWPVKGDVVVNVTKKFKVTNSPASWWTAWTNESFNGVYNCYMGDPVDAFASNAFASGSSAVTVTIGGVPYTYYANTPICWVGATEEPGSGAEQPAYYEGWAEGWSTLESAWAGRYWPGGTIVAVTDICLVQ
jgi:autotransporter-associated beta strand protein